MGTEQPNLVLVGFMGTGKSTVGPILAREMGRMFIDTDQLIEQEAGLSVGEIFARRGEAAFRALEADACHRIAKGTGLVVAVGGGALLNPSNRAALEASGVLVLLSCNANILVQRLTESARRGERPLLAGNVDETVEKLLIQRAHVYSSVGLLVDTTQLSPQEVAEAVLPLYRKTTLSGRAVTT